tara:strand:- start:278 stop:523 length:246 start_codon:yes stop_codon:yes gene_type:complete
MKKHQSALNVGDLVMFKPEGTYGKWFGGKFAKVTHCSYGSDGKYHCRVKWLNPVLYFDRFATVSDFGQDNFILCSDNGKSS